MPPTARQVLPVIVLAQAACTSLWFAGNAVLPDLTRSLQVAPAAGHAAAAVQLGFIAGTLAFALGAVADRYPAPRVFCASALVAALTNLLIAVWEPGMAGLVALRLLTGFFLAGIYPVGMKLAADYYDKSLGLALGYLVGALVLGTAFPHLLKGLTTTLPWKTVVYSTSGLSVAGGLLLLWLVPDGPYRKKGRRFEGGALLAAFRHRGFRQAVWGYFGHMWELYAFWAFVPLMLTTYNRLHPESGLNVPVLSFLTIGLGSLSCVAGGYLSLQYGARRTAYAALLLSGCCCLLSPLMFGLPAGLFTGFLIFWGLAVIADSPLFSTLVAAHAPADKRGTALTLVICIGFAVTIGSIELLGLLSDRLDHRFLYLILAAGPAAGLWGMRKGQVPART